MKYVRMTQLRTLLARYLRAVEAGDSLTVTVHNRPVAKVIPIPAWGKEAEEALNSLAEKGLLRPAKRRPKPLTRALKVRNVRIAEAVLEGRGELILPGPGGVSSSESPPERGRRRGESGFPSSRE